MSSHGFIVNDAEVAGITNVFTSVLLHEDLTVDPNSSPLPGSGYLSYADFKVDITVGAVTEVELYFSWDSAGDEIAYPVTSCLGDSLVVGHTDTSLLSGIVSFGKTYRAPSTQTTVGKLYGWVRASAGGGTITLKTLRVHFSVPHMRA